MQHARSIPSLMPATITYLRFNTRFTIRPQLLTRDQPLPLGRHAFGLLPEPEVTDRLSWRQRRSGRWANWFTRAEKLVERR
jgi:hypothetical protein